MAGACNQPAQTVLMVDEQRQSSEQRISMYVRIAIMLSGLFLLFAIYLFILPSLAPQIVANYIVEPRVVLRAYYSSDDKELTNTLSKRFIRYSGEDTARLALEGLAYADEERRIKSMRLLYVSNREMCYKPLITVYRDQTRSDDERYTALRVLNHIGQLERRDLEFLIDQDCLRDFRWLRLLDEQLAAQSIDAELKQRLRARLFSKQNTLKESIDVAVLVNDDIDEFLALLEQLLTLHDLPNQRRTYSYLVNALAVNPKQILEQYLREPGFYRDLWIELLSLEFQVLSDTVKQEILQRHADLPSGMLVDMIAHWKFRPSIKNAQVVISVLNENYDAFKSHKLRHDNYDQLIDCLSAVSALGSLDKRYANSPDTVMKTIYLASLMQSVRADDIMKLSTHIELIMRNLGERKITGHHLIDQALVRRFRFKKTLEAKQLLGVATYSQKRPSTIRQACKQVAFYNMLFNRLVHFGFYNQGILDAWYSRHCAIEGAAFLQMSREALRVPPSGAVERQFNQLYKNLYKNLYKDPSGKRFLNDLEQFLQTQGNAKAIVEAMQAIRQGSVK